MKSKSLLPALRRRVHLVSLDREPALTERVSHDLVNVDVGLARKLVVPAVSFLLFLVRAEPYMEVRT